MKERFEDNNTVFYDVGYIQNNDNGTQHFLQSLEHVDDTHEEISMIPMP